MLHLVENGIVSHVVSVSLRCTSRTFQRSFSGIQGRLKVLQGDFCKFPGEVPRASREFQKGDFQRVLEALQEVSRVSRGLRGV